MEWRLQSTCEQAVPEAADQKAEPEYRVTATSQQGLLADSSPDLRSERGTLTEG